MVDRRQTDGRTAPKPPKETTIRRDGARIGGKVGHLRKREDLSLSSVPRVNGRGNPPIEVFLPKCPQCTNASPASVPCPIRIPVTSPDFSEKSTTDSSQWRTRLREICEELRGNRDLRFGTDRVDDFGCISGLPVSYVPGRSVGQAEGVRETSAGRYRWWC